MATATAGGEVVEETTYSESWDGSDTVILVENKQLHVHKIIITMGSLKFKHLLDLKDINIIKLDGVSKEAMVGVLDIIYQKKLDFKDTAKFEEMLKIGQEYGIESVNKIIDYRLCGYTYSNELLYLADKYDLKKTRKRMIAYMVHNENANILPAWGDTLKSLQLTSQASKINPGTFFCLQNDKVLSDTIFEVLLARLVPSFIENKCTCDSAIPGNYNVSMPAAKYNAIRSIVIDACQRFPDVRAYYDRRFGSF